MTDIRLERLKVEGRLQSGDGVSTTRLGKCRVVSIENATTITVKSEAGLHYRITGLCIGSAARVVRG
jgi:hypothetical protein